MAAHSVRGQGQWKQNETVTHKTNIDRSTLLDQQSAFYILGGDSLFIWDFVADKMPLNYLRVLDVRRLWHKYCLLLGRYM